MRLSTILIQYFKHDESIWKKVESSSKSSTSLRHAFLVYCNKITLAGYVKKLVQLKYSLDIRKHLPINLNKHKMMVYYERCDFSNMVQCCTLVLLQL